MAARLGSSVRSQGLYLDVRERLPKALRTFLTVSAGELTLRVPASDPASFSKASAIVSTAIEGGASRMVRPRELEDILGISTSERRRRLADGRLLANDVIEAWRADDAEKAAEKRRTAARRRKSESGRSIPDTENDGERFKLRGWAELERNRPLV